MTHKEKQVIVNLVKAAKDILPYIEYLPGDDIFTKRIIIRDAIKSTVNVLHRQTRKPKFVQLELFSTFVE